MQSVIDLLKAKLDEMGVPLRARRDMLKGEGVVYAFNTTSFNGSLRTARLKCSIYALTMERGVEIETALDRLLVPVGDRRLTATCTAGRRDGGGYIEDGDWHIRIAYYDFVLKK